MAENHNRVRVGDVVTIYQRGKKRTWIADFWLRGQHIRQSLRTSNKKMATERAIKLDAKLVSGTYQAPPPAIGFLQATDEYLNFLDTERRARKTIVKYRGILTSLTKFLADQGCTLIGQFNLVLWDRYRASRKGRHPKTMYTEAVIVKQFLKWCNSRALVGHNVLADLRFKKPALEPRGGPTLSQINLILPLLGEPQRTQISVLAFTGMRAGELQKLKPSDLDLAAGWVHVRSRPGAETKTRTSRKVPIHPRLGAVLKQLPATQQPWLFTMPSSAKYPGGDHELNVKKLNEVFKRAVKKIGLPVGRRANGFTVHSLRHSFEAITVNSRVPQRVIDTWLGHSTDKSMAAHYYRLTDEESQRFMREVPFENGYPATDAGGKE
jgi:integrase